MEFPNYQKSKEEINNWLFQDNGFLSLESMRKAHEPIIRAVLDLITKNESGNILDLGCGNGSLLKEVINQRKNLVPYGIEFDNKAFQNIKELLSNFSENFIQGNYYDPMVLEKLNTKFTLTILMPSRFLETNDFQGAKNLNNWLSQNSSKVLAYAYSDKLKKFKSFSDLLEKSGFEIESETEFDNVAIINPK
ncbi:MAG TPA: methyltransferase [Candidatus Moranbacteria bacterium]|nr:methyltransferase [Candidatus Moranbacteria bacterium]